MNDSFKNRSFSIILIICVLAFVLVSRLVYIQVFAEEYKEFADENTRSEKVVEPARGLILDRNGKTLVSNETVYDLIVVLSKMSSFDTTALCNLIEVEKEYLENQFAKYRSQSRLYTPTVMLRNLPANVVARFNERKFDFRGFYVESRIGRKFDYPVAAHVLAD